MPHKHTRREKVESTYDLPPHQIAKPLPVVAPGVTRKLNEKRGKAGGKKNGSATPQATNDYAKPKSQKRKRGAPDPTDDAPRAFKRMMWLKEGKLPKDGLDDGVRKPKKKGKAAGASETAESDVQAAAKQPEPTKEMPTIRPGERMSEFAARVDAALPVMGLVAKGSKAKDPLGLKQMRTKKERKMHKLYGEWRREEEVIQEKRREEAEEAEEREMEDDSMGVKWRLDMEAARGKKKGKKGKKGKSVYETDDGIDDPWAELKKKRGEPKIGMHDVAKAPPIFKTVPKEVFKVRGAAVNVGSIPKAAGSLKRREELQEVREEVVAQYRTLMEGKRAKYEQATEDVDAQE